jgi:hypothetical protein
MADLLAFLQLHLGQVVGDTGSNHGQCVGLVEAWGDANHKPHIWGNAAVLLANADKVAYKAEFNTPTNYPTAGNIVVWGPSWGAGMGHCAVVLAANVGGMAVFEQNDPEGAPCLVGMHDYDGVLGWLSW